ncbi:hypothetical protein V496_06528 [Pseudogymnoascus sp. VKM F-4515 (FW-2607)]|nr:hypothetical protein V496_06528 [Pseudogymnoascus sp. VKM F-4515 (FW-2607)]
MPSGNHLPSRPLSVAIPAKQYCPRRPTLREVLANSAPPPWTLSAFTVYLSQNHCLETLEFTMDATLYRKHYEMLLANCGEKTICPRPKGANTPWLHLTPECDGQTFNSAHSHQLVQPSDLALALKYGVKFIHPSPSSSCAEANNDSFIEHSMSAESSSSLGEHERIEFKGLRKSRAGHPVGANIRSGALIPRKRTIHELQRRREQSARDRRRPIGFLGDENNPASWLEGISGGNIQAQFRDKNTNEMYRILVNNVKDYAIFMLDMQGHITTWNAGASILKQYEPEEIIGQHFSIFYGDEDLAAKKPQKDHEMRTPMHGMMGASSLLMESDLTNEQNELAQIIEELGKILSQVINDILDYSNLASGFLTVTATISVPDIISAVVRAAQVTLPPSFVLEAEAMRAFPKNVESDPFRFRQVLQNIVSNAVKITEQGSIRIITKISAEDDTSYTLLT